MADANRSRLHGNAKKFGKYTGGLQVIGAGAGRTGTTSLKLALEILYNAKCYHFDTITQGKNFHHCQMWNEQYNGVADHFDTLLEDNAAAVDWPASFFYEELMAKYPDAKVVLTVREPEKWYESMINTLYAFKKEVGPLWIAKGGPLSQVVGMATTIIWDGFFGGKVEDRQFAIDLYKKQNLKVRQTVPPHKLLVFEVKDGWEPLCKFLGEPIPSVPFPNSNDTEAFRKEIATMKKIAKFLPFVLTTLAAVAVTGVKRFMF
ncbi:hypothetical protein CYMTET_53010 [Cymbomonas tetramitiformis]|uniref:Uncharacterized protein n=1 Tax=Cymbomonas tetramitiformis TaxID=36881 RepID=A0AAE0BHU6_9CHLO|nr:hypothetical protein CYMTET_53010 [Cymbomonas tetramitiformis]|eukprot:gene18195-21676_t